MTRGLRSCRVTLRTCGQSITHEVGPPHGRTDTTGDTRLPRRLNAREAAMSIDCADAYCEHAGPYG